MVSIIYIDQIDYESEDSVKHAKGQLISEWIFGVFNFPKKTMQKFDEISALESKKWFNQRDKGTLLS